MGNIWTKDPFVFKSTSSGVDIYSLLPKVRLGVVPYGTGTTSVWADDTDLYFGTTDSGIMYISLASISGSNYSAYSVYKDYPNITNNYIQYIHGAGDFLCATTLSGVDTIQVSIDDRAYTSVSGAGKCYQMDDGALYYAVGGTLTAIYDSSNDWLHENLVGIGHTYEPGDGVLESRIESIEDIHVTKDTSTKGGNVLFLGTDRGATVIEEDRGSEDTCERRWFYIGNLASRYKWLTMHDGARRYSDGTYADSAYSYRYPTSIYTRYSGDIGDGWYWIKPEGHEPVKMYCDMTTEGGGYDYYPVDSGLRTYRYTDNFTGKNLGLNIIIPRSREHWIWMLAYFGTSYFSVVPAVYKETGGGNYTGYAMRDPSYYGSGAPDWRVHDGGRWWLRDTTYGEPNGDYTAYAWLTMYNWSIDDLRFNDAGASYSTTKYLCSTNKKP
jgi:hypothetical protein